MGPRYGYFTIDRNLAEVWKISLSYWNSREKTTVNGQTSFATDKYAKLNISRKRSLGFSEQYYIKFVKSPDRADITHVKIYFEYMGDSLGGATSRMERAINDWIAEFNSPPIKFQKKSVRENEIYFSDLMEEQQPQNLIAKEEEGFGWFLVAKRYSV